MQNKIVFDELLAALKKEGFSVSLHDYIEFAAVFEQYKGDRKAFKYYLAPIICRNKEEQRKFYGVYDRFFTKVWYGKSEGYVPDVPKQQLWVRNFYFWLFLLLLLSGIWKGILVSLQHKEVSVAAAPSTPVTPDTKTAIPEPNNRRPVFVAKSLRPVKDSVENVIQPMGQRIEKENSVHSTVFAWLLVLGGACLVLSASFFPQNKSRYLPEVDLDTREGDGLSLDIPFLSRDHLIQRLPIMAKIAEAMRQPVSTEVYRLDIQKTIRESVRQYGLLSPVYNHVEKKPEYLVLIDRRNVLFTHLYRYLVQVFINDRVNISYYFYEDGSAYYSDGSSVPVTVPALWERHGNARLVIIGNGYHLLPERWEKEFEPAAPFDILFRTDGATGFYIINDIAALRAYLEDEDLVQWVCAAAVYPAVKWEMLIAIGAAVLEERMAPDKLNFTNLLTILRIRWMNGETIPVSMRVELLKALEPRTELSARKVILELLKESDVLIAGNAAAHDEILRQRYTQIFVLYANDVKEQQYAEAAKKFMALWNKKKIADLATVIYLKNAEKKWETPLRSGERTVGAERFMNELLALRVISNPTVRAVFRNVAMVFFMLLLLLFLFKDNIQSWGINSALGLISSDYRDGAVTVVIPVDDCLRKQADNGLLTVTLNNYDNNRYTKTYALADRDSLRVRFDSVTMSGKAPDKAVFQLILGKDYTIDGKSTAFYTTYLLLLKEEDCARGLYKPGPANYYKREGPVNHQ